ncbi:hypothetical protein [Streptomyces sp. NBC_00046]|uniref:hypothetical protein n=1 Tax=Streptomyces sp. NBC_00046 TaxID=2975626 RepID=UPI00325672BF
MAFTFARRAAVAMTSVAVAVAGLLVTGGSASATTPTTGNRPTAVSRASSPAGTHHQDGPGRWDEGWGRLGSDRHAYRIRHDGGHHHWDRDHDDNRYGYRTSDDDLRRQWVLDQIYWMRDHDTRR